MNEKEAREIAQTGAFKAELGDRRPEMILNTGIAIGYLEAIKKARILVDALWDIGSSQDHKCECTCADQRIEHAREAIKKWEKEK